MNNLTEHELLTHLCILSAEIAEACQREASDHGSVNMNDLLGNGVSHLAMRVEQYAAARDARLLAEATRLQPAHEFDGLPF